MIRTRLFIRPILCCISDPAAGDPVAQLRAAEQYAVEMFQFRHKDLSEEERLHIGASLAAVPRRQTLLLVSQSVELARAVNADGVHFQASSFPGTLKPEDLEGKLAGVSVHSLREAVRAAESWVDYLLLAPVFTPLSKPAATESLGVETLRQICSAVSVPVIALGGMTPQRFAEVLGAGAAGVAGISLFAGAERMEAAVEEFRKAAGRRAGS